LDRAAIERIKAASAQAETGTGANAGKKGKFFAGVGWIQTRLRGIGVTSSKRRVSDYLGG
jgi:hypothetical protein